LLNIIGNIDILADAPSQALLYWRSGAAAISVLTEPKWFKGQIEDMLNVRRAFDDEEDRPAVLRKDFIIDIYQVYEARCFGADSILLIVAILSDKKLVELLEVSRMLEMEPLVEVANEDEMKRALSLGAKVIGGDFKVLTDSE
jgi:anthranilate synthase/indole-3-glycerol phosphate synthase/phosphoribosylanthranilate isomerase